MEEKNGIASKLLCTVFFLALIIGAAALHLSHYLPGKFLQAQEPNREYDRAAMQASLAPGQVAETFEELALLGSRAVGQPGHKSCEEWIRSTYQSAGLEIHEQELDTVHPVTTKSALRDLDGRPHSVEIYPVFPNNLQPAATDEKGITGELRLITESSLAEAVDFHGQIALINLSLPAPKAQGYTASRYAALGFSAIIYTHTEGFSALAKPTILDSANLTLPMNFVSVFASSEVLALNGKKVNLAVNVSFQNVPNRNLIGILRAENKSTEAIVVPVSYDGYSPLPDLNHSSFNALQLAIQQNLLRGVLPSRKNLRRDMIFIATGSDFMARNSQNQLLRSVGQKGEIGQRKILLSDSLKENLPNLVAMDSLLPLFNDPSFCLDPEKTLSATESLAQRAREILQTQFTYLLKTLSVKETELLLQARIAFEKSGRGDTKGPLFKEFRLAKTRCDLSNTQASYPLDKYLRQNHEPGVLAGLRASLLLRLQELQRFHALRDSRLKQDLALNAVFSQYENFIVLAPAFVPAAAPAGGSAPTAGKESISFSAGPQIAYGDHAMALKGLLEGAIQELALGEKISVEFNGSQHGGLMNSKLASLPIHGEFWSTLSYPGFSLISPGNSYSSFSCPVKSNYSPLLPSLQASLSVYGESVLAAACGNGTFPGLKRVDIANYSGNVYASGIGTSIVPNYPMARAVVCTRLNPDQHLGRTSGNAFLIVLTDPYGHYDIPFALSPFAPNPWNISPVAACYDKNGIINFFSDEGEIAQRIYKSIGLNANNAKDINLIVRRCSAVTLLDRTNPQTFRNYSDASFIRKLGMASFKSTSKFSGSAGILEFLDPADTFFVTLKAGAPGNDLVATTRAFMLNTPVDFTGDPEKEIDGLGYRVQDTPILYSSADEIARSMIFLNQKRLLLQEKYGMADDMTLSFHEKSKALQKTAQDQTLPLLARNRSAASSVTYSTLNHPIIRTSVAEAIWGILWYMGLLVPFVFFFEKLVFAYTDIRKALAAQAVVFLVVFFLLQLLHPAFQMIRSSVMILLGFIILLISSGIMLILSGKFRENLEALQQAQGQVKGAQGNRMGIIITAFMLGLNNMHRRKVRTGLTCATLVLLTFVMICFTSVQSDIIDTTTAVSKSDYQGILVKNEEFSPLDSSEVSALQAKYGHSYEVVSRSMFVGGQSWNGDSKGNPSIEVTLGKGEDSRSIKANSCLLFDYNDPLRNRMPLLAGGSWFTKEESLARKEINPIIISDAMARALAIDPLTLAETKPLVMISGVEYLVKAVFKAEAFPRVLSLDGDNLLPFDMDAIQKPKSLRGDLTTVLAERNDPRMSPEKIFLALNGHFTEKFQVVGVARDPRITAAIVNFGNIPYKIARDEIDSYLEQSGKTTYYGLDGISYLGKRARERSLAGLIDMLIPLIIAGLTVLNTMKGSVYERKDEIFVYNAVGIAPRYVFFMFIAEALVYAVMGALLGYLLSQGTGRILTELGWTGGLNMNFTSLATVYASLTITAAVFLSTWFPARSAMAIAEPAEDSGWSLPEAKENTLSFDLPFTFTHRDRIAVLGFFHKFLVNHGEGSAGPFFSGKPCLTLSETRDSLADNAYIPMAQSMIWLKPFDLGVSQRLEIELATDKDTGEFISRVILTRVSGTRESWQRLNRTFVARLRQQFLHWRAVSEEMKEGLFVEAKALLASSIKSGEVTHV